MRNEELLEKLAEYEGYDDYMEMLKEATFDSVAIGICTECKEYTTQVEPDCSNGFCEECESNTVVSCLVLADLI
jgi:hypothetical protein